MSLLHTSLHATRQWVHRMQDDDLVSADGIAAARDCLQVAVKLTRWGEAAGDVLSAWQALAAADLSTTEIVIGTCLARIHATRACDLGGDTRLPPPVELFATVERLIPSGVMKHQIRERFEWAPFVIVSYPQGPRVAVYGIFSVSLCAMKKGQPMTIKQDFLVYERTARPEPVATYYSGWNDRTDDRIQHIERFCERFGAPHYGCRLEERRWVCDNHWYADPDDVRLPREEHLRRSLRETFERARLRLAEVDCPRRRR